MYLLRLILLIAFIHFSGQTMAQNKQAHITYRTVEFISTMEDVARDFNISLPPNIDSFKLLYDPKSIGEKPLQMGELHVNRDLSNVLKKFQINTDTVYKEFNLIDKVSTTFVRLNKKDGIGKDTVTIAIPYANSEDEFYIYKYKYELTGNRKAISGYLCEQLMIIEVISSKIDGSKQELSTNCWITKEIKPAISLQSVLMLHEDILPEYTVLEAIRTPYGQGPHYISATQIRFK